MPGLLPLDEPPRPMTGAGPGVWQRLFPLWDTCFAVVAVAVVVAITAGDLPGPRRLTAIAAITAGSILYVAWGRTLIRGDRAGRPALVFVLAEAALFAVAVAADPTATYLLFVINPLIFLAVGVRPAVPVAVAVNLVPSVVALLERGPAAAVHEAPFGLMALAFAVLVGLWGSRVIEQSKERAELIAELELSRAEVARLSHTAGVAAERARLAGDIHDTLAQGFTSIITLLQAADPELADERLALAVRTARENLAESRAMVAALTPAALAESSLPEAVGRQVARFTQESGIPATCRTSGEPRALPTAVEVVLLRAAQEALTNVRRHAGAREAAVLLAYSESAVRLVVRDDGAGFVPGGTAGYGLAGMQARAGQVDGTLVVHSNPDTGTTIELEVPG
ncbi:sensor histidine kinase [Krasilnikovia sp. MM14-A1259]|uniref:sensor histidine kinase n=1 Tax=Krasilnikovia sp. MM14-A1259 TaxID=3373539 RepID=UPI0038279EEE